MIRKRVKALVFILGACIFAGCGKNAATDAGTAVETGTEVVEDSEAYEKFEDSVSVDETEAPVSQLPAEKGYISSLSSVHGST